MQRTPLYDEALAAGGRFVDFHGWELPVQFTGILQEHLHTRSGVSLFDCSHMGKFRLDGRAAIESFDRLICLDVAGLAVGRGRYGALLNESAGIIDDIIVFRVSEESIYIITNAGPVAEVAEIFRSAAPNILDLSAPWAKMDVQGPGAREVMVRAGFEAAADLRYFCACMLRWNNVEMLVSRAGYTGELGYEIYLPAESAAAAWRAFMAQGALPAGLGARDTLRTEMGYPLSGQDVSPSYTPLEAGMERFIPWHKSFVGRDALEAQRAAGIARRLTPIRTRDRRAPRHEFDVLDGEISIGIITSGTFGPSVGHGVGLAYLPPRLPAGHRLAAGPRRLEVEITELPFYRGGTCRD